MKVLESVYERYWGAVMIKKLLKMLFFAGLVVAMTAGAFAGGILYDQRSIQPRLGKVIVPPGSESSFALLVQAWDTVRKNYVDQSAADSQTLTYGAISGMVTALGDTGHSRFLTPAEVEKERSFESGTFEGIGARLEMKGTHPSIVAPFEGSPAQKAGVRPGDLILKVDGVDVTGQDLSAVVQRILGPAGTKVDLTLQDPQTKEIRTLTITRAQIKVDNVTWAMLPGTEVADIELAAFSQNVTADLVKAIQAAQTKGAKGIILDLRYNPGGQLNEAVGVASQFLKSGNVLQVKNADGKIRPVPVKTGGIATDIPMVVLINHGTASAAEIVSGALQDAGRAVLLGETTYGTGTVLLPFTLSDKSELLLAIQEWLTPKGRVIWHKGIEPDQAVAIPAGEMPLSPDEVRSQTAEELQSTQDAQLLAALELLQKQIAGK